MPAPAAYIVMLCLLLLTGCHASDATVTANALPGAGPLTFDEPETRVRLERVVAADWSVPLAGLLDLRDERARAAGLENRLEPIEIAVFVVEHPRHGIWLLDSGVAERFGRDETPAGVSVLVARAMGLDRLVLHRSTKALLAALPEPPRGVLLTHLHLDHVMGAADLDPGTPVWAGPGGGAARDVSHVVTRSTIDAQLAGVSPVRELPLLPDPSGSFVAGLDLFGDGSLQVLHTPGHTPGHLSFLVRAEDGDHLVVGDASHTAWGWANGVQPGSYTLDAERGADSLERLRRFADTRPMTVHPGHQPLP